MTNAGVVSTSPNHPSTYPQNMDCVTSIRLDPGEKIILKFLDFELDESLFDDWYVINHFDDGYIS